MKEYIFLFKAPDHKNWSFLGEAGELPSEVSVIKNGGSTDAQKLVFESHKTGFQHHSYQ